MRLDWQKGWCTDTDSDTKGERRHRNCLAFYDFFFQNKRGNIICILRLVNRVWWYTLAITTDTVIIVSEDCGGTRTTTTTMKAVKNMYKMGFLF